MLDNSANDRAFDRIHAIAVGLQGQTNGAEFMSALELIASIARHRFDVSSEAEQKRFPLI